MRKGERCRHQDRNSEEELKHEPEEKLGLGRKEEMKKANNVAAE